MDFKPLAFTLNLLDNSEKPSSFFFNSSLMQILPLFTEQARTMSNNSNSASDAFVFELFEGDPENLKTVVATAPNQITTTHHRSTEDYDEHHEVAAKMLHPIKEDHMQADVDRFQNLISTTNGKMCVVMKFYEGSIGDRMARLKGILPLRYGIELAQGTRELHLKGILVLNLKPCNFLLNENDQVFLGDMGIPQPLLGIRLPTPDMALRLGTSKLHGS